MRFLLCTNGTRQAALAMGVGAQLARQIASAVDILAVPKGEWEDACSHQIEATVAELETVGLRVNVYLRQGSFVKEIIEQAGSVPYDLVVIGSRGRRGIVARLAKSVALEVTGHVPASVLVVKETMREFQRFLVCTSVGPISERPVRFAADLARGLGASVTLLHVMSQLPLAEDAELVDLVATADELFRRNSREGQHLRKMLALLEAEGVAARATVRHGLVLDEIRAEAREGQYDLIIAGSHITPGIHPFLVENLEADIVLAARCPVLIVR